MGELPTLILVLLLLALFLRVDFIFYIVYVCVGVYAWSRWYTPRVLRGVLVARRFADHAFLGERVTVALHLENRNWLPIPWLQLTESIPPELGAGITPSYAFSLPGRGGAHKKNFSYTIRAARRGYYRLGPLTLRTGDLFGWNESNAILAPGFLTVYPRITPLAELGLPSRLPFGTLPSTQRLFEDPARPAGVRNYRSGDPLRQINWKVSAHHDELVVRTFQPAISLETAILLNLNSNDYARRTRYSAPEWAIEVAASLAAHLADRRQPVGLMTNGVDPLRQQQAETGELAFDEISGRLLLADGEAGHGATLAPPPILPRPGRAHLMNVLEILARVEVGATVSFPAWTPRATLHLGWGVTVLAITPVAGEAICQTLHRLLRAGYNPVLIVTAPVADFSAVRAQARGLGFTAYHVPERKDLDVWRRPRTWN